MMVVSAVYRLYPGKAFMDQNMIYEISTYIETLSQSEILVSKILMILMELKMRVDDHFSWLCNSEVHFQTLHGEGEVLKCLCGSTAQAKR